MKRVKDKDGIVHFRGIRDVSGELTLCGCRTQKFEENLFGARWIQMPDVSDPVTCPNCATLYCRIKNSPWNEVDGAALDDGIYEAVKEDDDAGTPLQ